MPQTIAVIGAGTMGNGIAHVFAQAGYLVHLIDTNSSQLEKAVTLVSNNIDRQILKGTIKEEDKKNILLRINTLNSISDGVKEAFLVVEAASENIDLKLKLFSLLDGEAPADCILATNTSSISITRIAAATRRPAKVIGMHFMNPVPVINGYATDPVVTEQIVLLCKQLGKIPCVVNDYPGFISNRILMPMINEAIHSLFEGIADVEAIDEVMKSGMAHPMGPLQLADFIGLDVCYATLNVLYTGFGKAHYVPCPLLTNMVNAGYLGIKSGEGFYKYEQGRKELIVSKRFTS